MTSSFKRYGSFLFWAVCTVLMICIALLGSSEADRDAQAGMRVETVKRINRVSESALNLRSTEPNELDKQADLPVKSKGGSVPAQRLRLLSNALAHFVKERASKEWETLTPDEFFERFEKSKEEKANPEDRVILYGGDKRKNRKSMVIYLIEGIKPEMQKYHEQGRRTAPLFGLEISLFYGTLNSVIDEAKGDKNIPAEDGSKVQISWDHLIDRYLYLTFPYLIISARDCVTAAKDEKHHELKQMAEHLQALAEKHPNLETYIMLDGATDKELIEAVLEKPGEYALPESLRFQSAVSKRKRKKHKKTKEDKHEDVVAAAYKVILKKFEKDNNSLLKPDLWESESQVDYFTDHQTRVNENIKKSLGKAETHPAETEAPHGKKRKKKRKKSRAKRRGKKLKS